MTEERNPGLLKQTLSKPGLTADEFERWWNKYGVTLEEHSDKALARKVWFAALINASKRFGKE